MDTEKKLTLMQNTYAAAVAETVNTYDRLKVLDTVGAAKPDCRCYEQNDGHHIR
jgi:hypothetical protein